MSAEPMGAVPRGGNPELPSPRLARALIRTLTKGTALGHGARYIHVGHASWLQAQRELLLEIAEDGYSDTKFVRGAYGSGKSHFLSVVQDNARDAGWMTAHIECRADGVAIDRFETLYPKLTKKLEAADIAESRADDSDPGGVDPIRHLLERWSSRILAKAGVRDGGLVRPFEAEDRLFAQLEAGLLRSALPPDFTKVLAAFSRARLDKDSATMSTVCEWLRGEGCKIRIPERYVRQPTFGKVSASPAQLELRPIGAGTAREIMRGLLWLIHAAGYAGLVLCIDEVEELAKLSSRRRQDQALQALREYVDHAGGDADYRHLCMYLAATPEMFEGPSYFPRYDALVTRIQPLGPEINWRAPVIDLDRTPLGAAEMRAMAMRIRAVHRVAYDDGSIGEAVDPALVTRFVDGVTTSRFGVAKPRLLARMMVDELERARQAKGAYVPPSDVSRLVADVAERIAGEAAD